ncbi:MAG: dethiobiotin synthase [Candidatus Gastranaerophilales bacterium]|nr:dethiobiotin synthase [Candidatus Gastranaerophilales bacterium]
MVKSLFITATGTDIGKTYISGLLVKKMREYGFNCGYFKPVLSGAEENIDGSLVPGDCKFVTGMAKLDIEPMRCLSYCFKEAVSPHLAAKRSGVKISKYKIIEDYNNLKKSYDYMILEGAGGITCPLCDASQKSDIFLLSDLIKCMDMDIIIVADGGLGTINSVVTTTEFARLCGITVKGIILNNFDRSNFMHRDNLYMTEKMTDINVIATAARNCEELDIEKELLESLFKED